MGKFNSLIIRPYRFIQYLFLRYPSTYVDKQFRKVLDNCISPNSILPSIDSEEQFIQLRKNYMNSPAARHSQVEARIAQSNETNEEIPVEQHNTTTSIKTKRQNKINFQDTVVVHYTHEKRFTAMKKDMHKIFREVFKHFGLEAVQFIVGHRNNPTSEGELIRKRPSFKYLLLKQRKQVQISLLILFISLYFTNYYEAIFYSFFRMDKKCRITWTIIVHARIITQKSS